MVVILKTDTNIGAYSIIHATNIARSTCTKICCKYVYTNACVCVVDNAIQPLCKKLMENLLHYSS